MQDSYKFELIGVTPLLMHADDVDESDRLTEWRKDPSNKKKSVPGDDRSPGWTWTTYLYKTDDRLAFPSDNIMVALRRAAGQIIMKGQKSFKEISQSGMGIVDVHCGFVGPKGEIMLKDIAKLRDLPYKEQADGVKPLGFELMAKRARVGQAKHVRVRPVFKAWKVIGTVAVFDEIITPEVLRQMFEIAGSSVGLGDWRPSSPKSPGPYGQFTAKLTRA